MSINLYWFKCGGCSGDTLSLLNAEEPDLVTLLKSLDVRILWQPSLSTGTHIEHREILDALVSGRERLDLLCVEGAVIRGPAGTGMFETIEGQPKKDLLAQLAAQAQYIIGVGTCATFGGVSADCEVEACGLQFNKRQKGGFLGSDFVTKSGMPVINLPGCPCHPDVVTGTFTAIAREKPIPLNEYNCPTTWYNMLVHQGCTRNEYHEYRVEDWDFGTKGCMFFHLGCQGPLAHGTCNKRLWNSRSSKTRVGVPCFGCTQPDFPQESPFFETPNIEGIPTKLPDGVDRAHYMAYKGMAAAAAPDRLTKRDTEV